MIETNERQALLAAREQALYIRRIREMMSTDPESGPLHEKRLRKEEERMGPLEEAAREAMGRMRPEMYAFCTLYYVHGMSLDEAAQTIDRSRRQCQRYRLLAEGAEK